ncbi:Sec63 Brl domain-containing protein [Cyathus striatus]|nr:Sec63 Brl domain-containing protein [Cyathus striatus]
MATYEYDEAGVMAAYFLITFLALVLTPLTISAISPKKSSKPVEGCQCQPCIEQRARVSKLNRGSIFSLSKKTYFIIAGWSLFAFIGYRVSGMKTDSKIYDPFEILGIKSDTTEKDIKSHFKKLSRMYHPDKVKATANQTIEMIQDRFVELTKAYKALTDETIRENWRKYNNPDGPQRMSMGIALPAWIIEGKNNIWVLGIYGIIFGGAYRMVGRWWFGSRQKTKDGINTSSAAASRYGEVVGAVGKVYKWEGVSASGKEKVWMSWRRRLKDERVQVEGGPEGRVGWRGAGVDAHRRKALVLLYAHLLRIDVKDAGLRKDQTELLLQSPSLLNALLTVSLARNWLTPTLAIMRLHAYLAQALPPSSGNLLRYAQLPQIKSEDVEKVKLKDIPDFVAELEKKGDSRVPEVKKALEKWGRVEIVDAAFKVIGERVVSPSSMINLVVKLRISPPGSKVTKKEPDVEEAKRLVKLNDEKDEKFLNGKAEAEPLNDEDAAAALAHAPYWPEERKPSWWVVLADEKSSRVVVPPFKVSDIPYADADADRDFRSYKLQFQGPNSTGMFTWKVVIVSDTYVGEEASKEILLKVEDPPAVEDDEDDISEPEEDTLAGQMAAMRGGSVKKRKEESDEESGTDDDQDSDSSSDSDSD